MSRLVLVSFETGNFRFAAYAVNEVIAREMLRQGWATHCARNEFADPVYLDEFYDDVNVVEFEPPCVLLDGWDMNAADVNGCDNQPTLDRIIAFVEDSRIGHHVDGESADEFSMDEVCALLHYHLGVQAYVEYTGGGCATIYAGGTFRNVGEAGDSDESPIYRNRSIAGPGWFEGGISSGLGKATASWHDFAIGKDDDGETQAGSPGDYGITNTRQIAALIALYVIDAADFDNVTAIGLDATQRGIPQNGA